MERTGGAGVMTKAVLGARRLGRQAAEFLKWWVKPRPRCICKLSMEKYKGKKKNMAYYKHYIDCILERYERLLYCCIFFGGIPFFYFIFSLILFPYIL